MHILVFFLKDLKDYDASIIITKEQLKVNQSSIYVIPITTPDFTVSPSYISVIQVDGQQNKIDRLFDDDRLRNITHQCLQVSEKEYHLSDVCNEVSINLNAFVEWKKDPKTSFEQAFLSNQDFKKLLSKWYSTIYLFINVKAKEELIADLIDYTNWLLNDSNQKITLEYGHALNVLDNDELSLNDNLLIFKQKLMIWKLKYVTKLKADFYEAFVAAFVNLNKGFILSLDTQSAYFAFSDFVFLRYMAQKYPLISIKIKEIHAGMELLEKLLSYPIKALFELNSTILDNKLIKLGNSEDKWKPLIKCFGFKNFEDVLIALDVLWEPAFKELEQLKWKKADLHLRLYYTCFLLRTNFGLCNQRKINSAIKAIETLNISTKKVAEIIAAAEIQHLIQLKNYKKLMQLKIHLELFKGLDVGFLTSYLQSKSRELNLEFNEIDERVLIIEYFDIKGFDFTDQDTMMLEGFLTLKTDAAHVTLNNLTIKMKTDLDASITLSSIPIKETRLKELYNEVKISLTYPNDLIRKINYLIIDKIEFEINGIRFNLTEFEHIKNKNCNLNKIPFLSVKANGFLHRLSKDTIFFEPNGPNFFYVEFTIFDNKNKTVDDVLLTLQKSSKYLIIDNTAYIMDRTSTTAYKMKNNTLAIDSLSPGKYVLLLKIFIVNKTGKNYKLKLNSSQNGRTFLNYITLKEKSEHFLYLDAYLEKVSEELAQLHLRNIAASEVFEIVSINGDQFEVPKKLTAHECYSHIIRGDCVIDIVYKLTNFEFQRTSVHNYVSSAFPNILYTNKTVKTQIMALDSLVGNNELKIHLLDLKNRKEIKAFEQNCFMFRFSYKPQEADESNKRLFIEFKWPKEKYVIIGKTRFELEENNEIQELEVYFIPLEGGHSNYPQVLLVELKADGSEHQLLLNDFQTNRKFFVQESIIKSAALEL